MMPSKVRRPIARPEEALQRSVVQYLARALPPRALFWHAHQNPKSKKDGGRLKGLGLKAGMPDLMILLDGNLYGLELKAPAGRLSPVQAAIADSFTANGAYWTVARSLDGVEAFLRSLEVPLRASIVTIGESA